MNVGVQNALIYFLEILVFSPPPNGYDKCINKNKCGSLILYKYKVKISLIHLPVCFLEDLYFYKKNIYQFQSIKNLFHAP